MTAVLSRVETRGIEILRPFAGNARTHSQKQLRQIAASIRKFGFTNPILISDDDEIVAGHGRLEAARMIGMTEVPVIRLSYLSPTERRAYVLADNKLALNAGWDQERLAIELDYLIDCDFDVETLGFSTAEIDLVLDAARDAAAGVPEDNDDAIPPLTDRQITQMGDVWVLGRHRLVCGDAQDIGSYHRLLDRETAGLLFTDPPYNVPIAGHVSGLGKHKHREFAFASGEMSRQEFTAFLATTLGCAAANLRDGAIAYVCMDWRHMPELLMAGELVLDELKQLCIWNKSNAGMGSFYRSKHELVFVYKIGTAPHINNFGLGDTGRYRTNVWDYAGVTIMSTTRDAELSMHPTVKPVRMVLDAIEDCSRRNDIILDCFGGSGTTLIAAERCGRRARLIEYDPLYCDTIVRRFEAATGRRATLGSGGPDFEAVAYERARQYVEA
jgi:DNA modification methylase